MPDLERPALYIVSTPIGNLGDITLRALEVLRLADVFFAEDTRTLMQLMMLLGVPLNNRPIIPCHQHNEEQAAGFVLQKLQAGCAVALVSDAGTPLVSDPGFRVVARIRKELGVLVPVRPVPGACAAIAALSVAGVSTSSYIFAGFPPHKPAQKLNFIRDALRQARSGLPSSVVFYEAPHRLLETLGTLSEVLREEGSAAERRVVLCRELTKRNETTLSGTVREVWDKVAADPLQQKGEFVLLVDCGKEMQGEVINGTLSAGEVMKVLATELPRNRAAALAAKICGGSAKELRKEMMDVKM